MRRLGEILDEVVPEVCAKNAMGYTSALAKQAQALYDRGLSLSDVRELLRERYGADAPSRTWLADNLETRPQRVGRQVASLGDRNRSVVQRSALKMAADGASIGEIREALGISWNMANGLLGDMRPPKRKPVSATKKRRAKRLRESGMSWPQVAQSMKARNAKQVQRWVESLEAAS